MNKATQKIRSPFTSLYDEAGLLPPIRRSLTLMLISNLCGNLAGIVCGPSSSAMVGLATSIGADDLAFGILTGLTNAFALLQIPFSVLVNRTHKRKLYIMTYGVISRCCWMLVGLIPYIIPGLGNTRLYVLYLITGIVACGNSMINVCWFPWLSDLAPETIRSRWISYRDLFINAVNIAGGIIFAILLDTLDPSIRYVIVFLVAGAISAIDVALYAGCKEEYSTPPVKEKMFSVLNDIRKDRRFMRFVTMWTVWAFSWNISGNFISPYLINEMHLSFTQMMVFGTITASVAGMLLVSRWGKAVFHFGSKSVMIVSCIGASFPQLFFCFSTVNSVVPLFLFNLLGAAFWCGCNMTCNSMILSISPADKRPSYVAVHSCIVCLLGNALSPVIGGALLEWWEASGWFTGWFDRYKVLFLLAFILRITTTVLLTAKLENENDKTARDLVRHIITQIRRPVRVRR